LKGVTHEEFEEVFNRRTRFPPYSNQGTKRGVYGAHLCACAGIYPPLFLAALAIGALVVHEREQRLRVSLCIIYWVVVVSRFAKLAPIATAKEVTSKPRCEIPDSSCRMTKGVLADESPKIPIDERPIEGRVVRYKCGVAAFIRLGNPIPEIQHGASRLRKLQVLFTRITAYSKRFGHPRIADRCGKRLEF